MCRLMDLVPNAEWYSSKEHFSSGLQWLQNVDFGLRMKGVDPAVVAGMVDQWLDTVGLQGFGDTPTYQLSGGMQQRVALAAVLSMTHK